MSPERKRRDDFEDSGLSRSRLYCTRALWPGLPPVPLVPPEGLPLRPHVVARSPDRATRPDPALWHGLPTVPPGPPTRCGTVSRPCHPARPRAVARSPDRATGPTEGLPELRKTFAPAEWARQE